MVCAIKPGEETIEEWVPRPETSPIRPVRPNKQRRESNTNSKVLSIYFTEHCQSVRSRAVAVSVLHGRSIDPEDELS